MPDCIFCRIVKGRAPAVKVMETPRVLAFLDIAPVHYGHTLVIPKDHYETFLDLPDDLWMEMGQVARRVAQALRQVLGPHVEQRGSNITVERLRFDFAHPARLTPQEIAEVESIVNQQIEADLPVTSQEMSLDQARESGAIGLFEDRYGDRVRVYTIGEDDTDGGFFSREICGGPHVEHTAELGRFHIAKQESIGSGLRRIRAVLESE